MRLFGGGGEGRERDKERQSSITTTCPAAVHVPLGRRQMCTGTEPQACVLLQGKGCASLSRTP